MSELYPLIKAAHMSAATLSLSGFVLRFVWTSVGAAAARHRLTRVLPHLLDTLLLLLGLTLLWLQQGAALAQPWLWLKLMCLLLYIALGRMALQAGRAQAARGVAFVAALAVFAHMVGLAITRSPWAWWG